MIDNLNAGARLLNANGTIQCGTPNPRPFLFVSTGSDNFLQPGEKAKLVLEFVSPEKAVVYTTRVLARSVTGGGGGGF